MISPDDIRNPKRVSGYDHVGNKNTPNHPQPVKPYQAEAYGGTRDKAGRKWFGPSRATAEEAAQDYCDYMNGDENRAPAVLRSMQHPPREPSSNPSDAEIALRKLAREVAAERVGRPGYVYLITDGEAVKLGHSVNPEARVGELQTGNWRPLRLLAKVPGDAAYERALHQRFIDDNLLGEWFEPSSALLSEFGVGWHEFHFHPDLLDEVTAA